MEAALDLFAEDGARGVSKRAICARARLNDRYFYEHFTDADAVIEAIVQDLTAEGLEAVNAASQKLRPIIHAQVQATAVAALDFLTSDPETCNSSCVRTPPRFCSAHGGECPRDRPRDGRDDPYPLGLRQANSTPRWLHTHS